MKVQIPDCFIILPSVKYKKKGGGIFRGTDMKWNTRVSLFSWTLLRGGRWYLMRLEMSVSRDTGILFPDRCSLRSRACWAFLVPTEYEPTTSRTWGLSYCIGEFSFHCPHVPWLLRVKADVGRLLGFLWVQIRPWKEVLARGRLAKMWRQWQGSMLVPDPWDEAVTSPAHLDHLGESPGHQWLCGMKPTPPQEQSYSYPHPSSLPPLQTYLPISAELGGKGNLSSW